MIKKSKGEKKMSDTIKIITYNTHLFGGTALDSFVGYQDEERIGEIMERIKKSDCDIICLCEVWSDSWKEVIVKSVQQTHPYHFYYDTSPEKMGDGLLVISKKPLSWASFIEFAERAGWDGQAQKGAFFLSVYWSAQKQFRIFFTHTQADKEHWSERKSNLEQVGALIRAYYSDIPALILGDLNVYEDEQNELRTILSGFSDAGSGSNLMTYDPSKNNVAQHFDEGGKAHRFDFILYSDPDWTFKSYEIITDWKTSGGTDCSDHYPAQASLELKTAKKIEQNVFQQLQQPEAIKALKKAHASYGSGVCNCILIWNNTTEYELRSYTTYSWHGTFLWLLPAPVIAPGEWTAVFHHHPNGEALGSIGCVIYRIFKKGGTAVGDVFLGFDTPFSKLQTNKVKVMFGECDSWWNTWSPATMYKILDDKGDRESKIKWDNFRLWGLITTGDSAVPQFVICDYTGLRVPPCD
jgi:endonuclease/exonuclease/phosphatase family metal-dependent hydrolase